MQYPRTCRTSSSKIENHRSAQVYEIIIIEKDVRASTIVRVHVNVLYKYSKLRLIIRSEAEFHYHRNRNIGINQGTSTCGQWSHKDFQN